MLEVRVYQRPHSRFYSCYWRVEPHIEDELKFTWPMQPISCSVIVTCHIQLPAMVSGSSMAEKPQPSKSWRVPRSIHMGITPLLFQCLIKHDGFRSQRLSGIANR
jgi:hypothetical protein